MQILGIETSCDETGVSLIEAHGSLESGDTHFTILADELASQVHLHAEYGGVFPSLAKREHIKALPLLLERITRTHDVKNINAIAVTYGPGLEPALWTGITFAENLAREWGVPLVPVNHMEGHVYTALLTKGDGPAHVVMTPQFPAVALLISGGHTDLVLINGIADYTYLGSTVDDAVGEAFDKVARMLGFGYPGGPKVSKLAQEARDMHLPPLEQKLPRPMLRSDDLNFSFSGLKTAVLYHVKRLQETGHILTLDEQRQVACEFENAVADVLAIKTAEALEQTGAQSLIIGGGVSANSFITERIRATLATLHHNDIALYTPEKQLTGDNGLMIAIAGYMNALAHKFHPESEELKATGTLRFKV